MSCPFLDSSETYYLVLQYAQGGNLKDYLQNDDNFKGLGWERKVQMAKDIANGLNYMHEKDIVHKDLVSIG